MAMSELHQQIHAALLVIHQVGPKDLYVGICANVITIIKSYEEAVSDDAVDTVLHELFEDWPDKTYSTAYPIGNWAISPSDLFWAHADTKRSMWDRNTKYGAARWALLEHCLNKLNQGDN